MTLQSSGPISIAQIAAEFGRPANTPFPSGFYGLGGAPASGPLSFADFYGRSAAPPVVFDPDGGEIGAYERASASVTLRCSQPATWTYAGGGTRGTVSVTSGGVASAISFAVTAQPVGGGGSSLTVTRDWSVTGVSGGVTRAFAVTVTAKGEEIAP